MGLVTARKKDRVRCCLSACNFFTCHGYPRQGIDKLGEEHVVYWGVELDRLLHREESPREDEAGISHRKGHQELVEQSALVAKEADGGDDKGVADETDASEDEDNDALAVETEQVQHGHGVGRVFADAKLGHVAAVVGVFIREGEAAVSCVRRHHGSDRDWPRRSARRVVAAAVDNERVRRENRERKPSKAFSQSHSGDARRLCKLVSAPNHREDHILQLWSPFCPFRKHEETVPRATEM